MNESSKPKKKNSKNKKLRENCGKLRENFPRDENAKEEACGSGKREKFPPFFSGFHVINLMNEAKKGAHKMLNVS